MIEYILLKLFILTIAFAQNIQFRSAEANRCQTPSGVDGVCVDLLECPEVVDKIRRHSEQPRHCRFNGRTPVVCCPRPTPLLAGTPTKDTPSLDLISAPANIRCGRTLTPATGLTEPLSAFRRKKRFLRSIVINNGVLSARNSWPWITLLGRNVSRSTSFFCSGSLINHHYVITAAHCVLDPSPFFVRLGEHDYKAEGLRNDVIQDADVTEVIFHPKYSLDRGYNDIALLKLHKKINFRREVFPICIPWGRDSTSNLIDETVTIAGWGNQGFNGPPSPVLMEATVKVFPPSVCEKGYSTLRDFSQRFPEGMNEGNILCAGDFENQRDACEGDSGGPLMLRENSTSRYTLEGVISSGFGCGLKDFPGLYAPLRNFETLRWIKETAFQM